MENNLDFKEDKGFIIPTAFMKDNFLKDLSNKSSTDDFIIKEVIDFLNVNPDAWLPDIITSYKNIFESERVISICERLEKEGKIKLIRGCM
jgi:hypothetical protein